MKTEQMLEDIRSERDRLLKMLETQKELLEKKTEDYSNEKREKEVTLMAFNDLKKRCDGDGYVSESLKKELKETHLAFEKLKKEKEALEEIRKVDIHDFLNKMEALTEFRKILNTATQRVHVAMSCMKDYLICQTCTKPIVEGYTCVPCCHSFCTNCWGPENSQCTECQNPRTHLKATKTEYVYKNKVLKDYNEKFMFMQESMYQLKKLGLAEKADALYAQYGKTFDILAAYKA